MYNTMHNIVAIWVEFPLGIEHFGHTAEIFIKFEKIKFSIVLISFSS